MEDAQEFVIESSLWTQIDGAPSSSSCSPFNIYFFHIIFILFFSPFNFFLLPQDKHLLYRILPLCVRG